MSSSDLVESDGFCKQQLLLSSILPRQMIYNGHFYLLDNLWVKMWMCMRMWLWV